MKKKILAAVSAAVLLCGAMCVPAAADTAYKKGDVNRDGEIAVDDAQLAMQDYVAYHVAKKAHILDDEQLTLADVTDPDGGQASQVTIEDCMLILKYYTACVAEPELKGTDLVTWISEAAAAEPKTKKSQYKMGDVNRDGEITREDARLVLKDYTEFIVVLKEQHILDEEQLALADIDGKAEISASGIVSGASVTDAYLIETYVKACEVDEIVKSIDIVEWYKTCFHDFVAWLVEQQELEEAGLKNSMDQ